MRYVRHEAGMASILAIFFVGIFAVLATAMCMQADLSFQQAANYKHSTQALFEAESGLAFYCWYLGHIEVEPDLQGQDLLDAVADVLADVMEETPNLQGQPLSYDGETIRVPPISTGQGRTFSGSISLASADTLRLSVLGQTVSGQAQQTGTFNRTVVMDFQPVSETSKAFDYGMFSKGPIDIEMNLSFTGANDPSEASIYSSATGAAIAVGSGYIGGDVCTADPDASVDIGATVNGHVDLGVGDIEPPEVNVSIFEPYATNIVDDSVDTSSGTFTNIRILAGTNPEFGNVTVQGVVFVEAPNYVYFKNNVDFTGTLVTEDPGEGASLDTHKIYFKNNLTMRSLQELPDTPPFAELRQMGGSAILAPGFEVEFKNNFQAIGGVIACESLILKNNLDARLLGPVIVYGNRGLNIKNNSTIVMDRSRFEGPPPGFAAGPTMLTPMPDTYLQN